MLILLYTFLHVLDVSVESNMSSSGAAKMAVNHHDSDACWSVLYSSNNVGEIIASIAK